MGGGEEGCWRALQNGIDMFDVFRQIRHLSNFLDQKSPFNFYGDSKKCKYN
jgi:hypothetical protein